MTPNTKQTVLTDPLRAAIQFLTEEADELRECCTMHSEDWADEPEAKAAYDRILAVVAGLEAMRQESAKGAIGISIANLAESPQVNSLEFGGIKPKQHPAPTGIVADEYC
ncbi:hypothetical protein D0839_14550 [Bordetella avium]|uniref:hypothetical protein n=1 Tax=Bordetella avium TaxID=521 RepID=UPI000E69256A|nr:hypothetical protein [Bordetella avium]RIQ67464.1 hypothetical protein D0839_14550 [Bordetella avium]